MKPWKTFVHYFIPHKRNKYRPHFLRVKIASLVVVVIIGSFALSAGMQRVLITSNSPQVAAVIASALVNLANNDRAQNNLLTLKVSPQLQLAAQAKANDMAANSYFAHVSPAGRDPWYWFTQAGYNFTYGGENLAVYFSDSNTVNTAWMNSPEHRANILNGHFTEIGVATAEGMYQGHQTTFVVQEFGTPESAGVVTKQSATPISSAKSKTQSVVAKNSSNVKGASIIKPTMKVLVQDKNFIAVENINAVTPGAAQSAAAQVPAPKPNPIFVFLLKFVTSPETDLLMLYGLIAVVIALALTFEVTTEIRRPHPRRIVLGLSMIGLMIVLVFVSHVYIFGQLLIT